MEHDTDSQLIDELSALARDYPEQPEWQEVLDQVRTDVAGPDPAPETQDPVTESPQPPPTADEVKCRVCEAVLPVKGQNLCADCMAIYPTISARVIRGVCDCGHAPQGDRAYRYHQGSATHTLCGLKCVKTHLETTFSWLLGAGR